MDDYDRGREDVQRDTQELARRILANPNQKLKIILEYYAQLVAAGRTASANEVLTFRAMLMAGEQDNHPTVPGWFQIAGVVFGALTFLVFIVLVFAGILGKQVPAESGFLVVIVMALGVAFSAAFLGGTAVASGTVPIFKESPLKFAVGGGIASFVIVLVLGHYFYP